MVPMRDGVRLATDVYHPALDGEAIVEAAAGDTAADDLRQG